jgi:uroporphyrinogen decarboxylase
VGSAATVLGFVGSPWTLAAYCVEGGSSKECGVVKLMMAHEPALLHALLAHLAEALGAYAAHQLGAGAQVVQVFDSWAHHLSPAQWRTWSLPYAERVLAIARAAHPHAPLTLHANGSAGKEAALLGCSADVLGLDWGSDLGLVRAAAGPARVLQGNTDPRILFAPDAAIRAAVAEAVRAGGRHHILNVGHGVAQGTPEASVALFCQLAREARYPAAE